MASEEHRRAADSIVARCAVITLSDTRDESTDTSGRTIRELLASQGHVEVAYHIIKDEPVQLEALLNSLAPEKIDVIISNGGTGISPRDQTIPTIQKRLDLELPGFGELFRMLSWEQIGSSAMLSRAIAGTSRGRIIFALPGSSKAVQLAMTKLILPEIKHLIWQVRGKRGGATT